MAKKPMPPNQASGDADLNPALRGPTERNWLWMILLSLAGSALIIIIYNWDSGQATANDKSLEMDKPAAAAVIYTCSMDPQVKSDESGQCPICRMPLTPMESRFEGDTLRLTGNQQLSMGLRIAPLMADDAVTRWPAQIVERSLQSVTVSARLGGRIVKVSKKAPGQSVAEGEALVWIFNPDLVTAQSDYLTSEGEQRQLAAERLYAMGISRESIKQLDETSEPSGRLVVRAPKAGILNSALPRNGQVLTPGQAIAQIQLYASNTKNGQAYTSSAQAILIEAYLPVTKPGSELIALDDANLGDLTAKTSSLRWESGAAVIGSGSLSQGGIALTGPELLPELDANGRTVLRLSPAEGLARGQLIPGQRGEVVWRKGASGSAKAAIKPPPSAILEGSDGPVVWVDGADAGVFIRRKVTINRAGEATAGLSADEKVVIKGANLLQAEWQLRAGQR